MIRIANDSDIPALNEILRLSKGYWGYDQAFMDAFMEKFALNEAYLDQNTMKVFCENELIIGFFSFKFQKKMFELDFFFLHPNFIGKGYGKQLWGACCAAAKELGAEEFTLWADPQTELFYTKMGCEKIGVKKSPFAPDRYPPIMRYRLGRKDNN